MKKFTWSLAGLIFIAVSVFGQGVANNTMGDPAHSSTVLDVSSNSGGLLIPRMPFLQRLGITSPATGFLVYQTNGATGID